MYSLATISAVLGPVRDWGFLGRERGEHFPFLFFKSFSGLRRGEEGVCFTTKLSTIMCFLAMSKCLPFSGGDRPEELTGKCSFYDFVFLVPL